MASAPWVFDYELPLPDERLSKKEVKLLRFPERYERIHNQLQLLLIIDEVDSLAAKRTQEHSHHEDKVAVNTLIQSIDNLRRHGGRVVTILCTNRLSVLDVALRRRAAVIEEFLRPTADERRELFNMD